MQAPWDNNIPIYKQLETRVINGILNKEFAEGEALPSVRQFSVTLQINHLTVAKAYQALAEQDIIEKKRGLGMFVTDGAVARLILNEKTKFFEQELPRFVLRLQALGISNDDMLTAIMQIQNNKETPHD